MIESARVEASQLPPPASSRLFQATSEDSRDAELAMLVRSAAAPGLKDRIAAYLEK